MAARLLTRADIMPMDAYARARREKRRALTALRRLRRVEIGPHASLGFENRETVWMQIHEMLHVERGGEPQIADELAAYNPLIPRGSELVATLMFEIDNRERRTRFLAAAGGVERAVALRIGDAVAPARPEEDVERTTVGGKASAVHFLRFPLTRAQIAAFRDPDETVSVVIDHPAYAHAAVIGAAARESLAADLDPPPGGKEENP